MSWLKKLTSGLKKSSDAVTASLSGISGLFGKPKIDAGSIEELEDALITADLGVQAATEIAESLRSRKWSGPVDADQLRAALAESLTDILAASEASLEISPARPHVILLAGVNGSGKTTTAGKLAARYAGQGKKVILAAADTFRAAAIEQLDRWGARSGVEVVAGERGGDAAALAYQALEKAQGEQADILIIDTAGRLQNRTELMDELAKIIRVLGKLDAEAPHDRVLVLDGTVGQNALAQLRIFQETAGITGLIITKLDGSAKGGVVVALAREFGLPLHLVGVGEAAEDLQDFNASEYARALVGLDPA